MSFKEEHPNYKEYKSERFYYSDVPYYFNWSDLESLVDEAGGIPEKEYLSEVVQNIATTTRVGRISGMPYHAIGFAVSIIRERVQEGKFYVLMDCLAILCDDGELSIGTLNEFLADYSIGYRACSRGARGSGISWEKIEDEDDSNSYDASYESDKAILLSPKIDLESKYKEDNMKNIMKKENHNIKKECSRDTVFISHRETDGVVADMILDFLVACGVPNDKIFCSSVPGNDVKEVISNEVKEKLKKATLIIVILSRDFYESAYCLNEAGVAWYLDDVTVIPFGLPEIEHSSMVGFLDYNYKLYRINEIGIAYLYENVKLIFESVSNTRQTTFVNEMTKLKEKYQNCLDERLAVDEGNKPKSRGGFKDSNKEGYSDNPVVQALLDADGKELDFKELIEILAMSKTTVNRKTEQAIKAGEIEVIGSNVNKRFRLI